MLAVRAVLPSCREDICPVGGARLERGPRGNAARVPQGVNLVRAALNERAEVSPASLCFSAQQQQAAGSRSFVGVRRKNISVEVRLSVTTR